MITYSAKTLLSVVGALLVTAMLCLSLDAWAQDEPGTQAWGLAHRAYRTQAMLDGSTAVWEYRSEDAGGHGVGPQDQPVRRVDAQHQTYLAWLAAGHQPQALPPQVAPPRPEITEAALAAQAQAEALADPEVVRARNLAADCLVDPSNLSLVVQGLGGPCVALQESYLLLRDTALAAALARLRAAYEVTP